MHINHIAASCFLAYIRMLLLLFTGSITIQTAALVPTRNLSTYLYIAKLRCRSTCSLLLTHGLL